MRKPLVAGNWKMNKTVQQATLLVADMLPGLEAVRTVDRVLCPPYTSLMVVSGMLAGTEVGLGAQNLHWEESGAFTGEISPLMVKEFCQYIIIGHSERRGYFCETDDTVNKKVKSSFAHGLLPIVCVGETLEQYEAGETASVVEKQVVTDFEGMDASDAEKLIVAYEPIWAIGTGKAATAEQANDIIKDVVRKNLAKMFGEDTAENIRILYGGSVKSNNAVDFFSKSDIDGGLIEFTNGINGLVLNLHTNSLDVILLGEDEGIQGGSLVNNVDEIFKIPVGNELIGRVVDALGRQIDGGPEINTIERRGIEQNAPEITHRSPINFPLQTGTKIIDALFPIGKGQRELIVGDRQTGKTTLAIDTIINQNGKNIKCIYVSIGQKKSSLINIIDVLEKRKALDYTIIISASPDDPPALKYLAPFSGMTIAEYFLDLGEDVLIVFDDLTKHANAYRELSLLLRRPPGREAYPGDIFYLHARLLERACKGKGEMVV